MPNTTNTTNCGGSCCIISDQEIISKKTGEVYHKVGLILDGNYYGAFMGAGEYAAVMKCKPFAKFIAEGVPVPCLYKCRVKFNENGARASAWEFV